METGPGSTARLLQILLERFELTHHGITIPNSDLVNGRPHIDGPRFECEGGRDVTQRSDHCSLRDFVARHHDAVGSDRGQAMHRHVSADEVLLDLWESSRNDGHEVAPKVVA